MTCLVVLCCRAPVNMDSSSTSILFFVFSDSRLLTHSKKHWRDLWLCYLFSMLHCNETIPNNTKHRKLSLSESLCLAACLAYCHSTCVVRNFILHIAEKHDLPTSQTAESQCTFFGRPVAPRNCSHPWRLGSCQDCPTSSTPGMGQYHWAFFDILCIPYLGM